MKCPACHFENTDSARFCSNCAAALTGADAVQPAFTKTIEKSEEELAAGSVFAGRYQVIEELGRGGMGKVYRVLDKKLHEEVALKLIKPEIASDKRTLERFKNELKLARKVSQKNVGRMFDIGEETGTHYITMEYVPGEDLKSFIRRVGQIPVGKSISIAKQICEGLSEAHGIGIVHRDLKPSNILIDKQGNARIMDFGIARSIEAKKITGDGVIIGTPEYMSPEQVEGKETDQRSDVYALGVILYEMLTGRLPFEGETPLSIAVQHRSDTPKDPRELNAQIPADLSRLILKCLEKEKGARYQTARELLSSLSQIEQGIPVTEWTAPRTKPITSKEITVRFTLKKLCIPAALLLVLAAIAFVIFRRPGAELDSNRVVVAIFENRTGDENLEGMGEQIAYSITQNLSQIDSITVVPLDTVRQISRVLDAEEIGQRDIGPAEKLARTSHARMVISGVCRLSGTELVLQAEIIDAKSGERGMRIPDSEGLLDEKEILIGDLSERVSGAICSRFDVTHGLFPILTPPRLDAYQEYMFGVEWYDRDLSRAFKHFEKAIEIDESFLAPRLPLILGNFGRDWEKVEDHIRYLDIRREKLSAFEGHWLDALKARRDGNYEAALHHSVEARKISPENIVISHLAGFYAGWANRPKLAVEILKNPPIEAYPDHFSTGWAGRNWFNELSEAFHMLGRNKRELKVIRQAQKLYPDTLLASEARALAALGRISDVKAVIDKSRAVTKEEVILGDIMLEAALELRAHGHYEAYKEIIHQAVEWYKSRMSEQERTESHRYDLAGTLYAAERWDEALTLYSELAEEFPENLTYLGRLGTIAARRGDRGKARQISEELRDIDRPYLRGENTIWRARISSLLGDKNDAFELLKESLRQGRFYGIVLLRDMDFEPLRNFKPFQELLKPKG